MNDSPIMPAQLNQTPRRRPGPGRVAFIFLLAVLTAVLMMRAGVSYDLASRGWFQPPSQVTIPADIMYRLSVALAAPRYAGSTEFIDARQLEQVALALYEQSALGHQPSAQASYRLAIFYAKSGYHDHAQELFLRAAQLDEASSKLYLFLSHLYSDEPPDEVGLLAGAELLDQQDRWLAGMTRADLYDRVGQADVAAQLRADWQSQQVLFATIIGGLILFYAVMGGLGLLTLLVLLLAWIGRKPQERGPRARQVPWGMLDIAEVVVVLVFLMVFLSVAASGVRQLVGTRLASETLDAVLVAVAYLLVAAGAVGLIVYRIGPGRPYWQLLGVRLRHAGRQIGQGVIGYAVFLGLLIVAAIAIRLLGGEGFLPLAQAPTELLTRAHSPVTLAVYFVLVAIVAPVVEEIIFRGFVYAGLRGTMKVFSAAVLSALIFASAHVTAPVGGLAVIGLFGVVLAYLYERTGSLLPSMITHSMYNSFVFFILATCTLL